MKLKSILALSSAMLSISAAHGQSLTTSGTQKYTLVEESTGTWCQYCPDGAQVIQSKIEPYGTSPNYPRAIIASFHNGGSDKMTLAGDPFVDTTGFISGWPQGTVDRTTYGTGIPLSRGAWPNAVGARDGMTAKFKVSMACTYDTATRLLTVKVTGKALSALTGNWRINAYVVEDSVTSAPVGYRQINAFNAAGSTSSAGGLSWYIGMGTSISDPLKYSHMDVVRKIMGASIWGDIAFNNPAINDSVSKVYTYTVPAEIGTVAVNYKHLKVIGLIAKYGTSTNDREIENCIEAKVKLMSKTIPNSIAEIAPAMEDVELFPNPATGYITVKGMLSNPSETNITITNMLGQVVTTRTYPAGGSMFGENISLAGIADGIYVMTIANDGAKVSKQFVVGNK